MSPDIPTRQQAEAYLSEAVHLNPGPWEGHARTAAQGAALIAAAHPGLQPDRAYVLGLLHDIGRRSGVTGMRHILDGYIFLIEEGCPGAARICLTHSFPIPGKPISASQHWDGTPNEWDFVCNYLKQVEYDDYDRLIQLCDAISLPSGFCLMEKRIIDVAMRYGLHEYTLQRWQAFFSIKEQFESAIGGSIYQFLPGVVENTFGWSNSMPGS